MAKIKTAKRAPRPAAPGRKAAGAILRAFVCGAGLCAALTAAFAFALANTPLPLGAAQPLACMAAAAGCALSGYVLAQGLGRYRLLCGLGCGAFYAACLGIAAVCKTGALHWQGSGAMLPLALLLGGVFGGAASAVRAGR